MEERKAGNSILSPEERGAMSSYCSEAFALVFCHRNWNYLDRTTRAEGVAKGQSVVSHGRLNGGGGGAWEREATKY